VNVEKVVSDPQNPIPKNIRVLGDTIPRYSELYMRIPSSMLPSTFTTRVPDSGAKYPAIRNLDIAPKNPPIPTVRSSELWFFR
jgi:hypothetical protein